MQRGKQSGFTSIEIAVVIAIISMLGTVLLVGQKLTINSKVNRLDHDFHSLQTAIYNLQDKLRPMHGNFRKASLQLTDSAAFGDNGNWNAIGWNWRSLSGETFNLWQNVRPTGFAASTDTNSNAYVPLKSTGGIAESEASKVLIAGLRGNYVICANNIAGRLVKQLDLEMDNGNTASGSMMVSNAIGGAGIATDNINNSSTYTVCLGV